MTLKPNRRGNLGMFEIDPLEEKLELSIHYEEIDILDLLERIQKRYYEVRERSGDSGFICVVRVEEWRALQYYTLNLPAILDKVRVPIQRMYLRNGLKSKPYLGLVIFDMQLIGSDMIGELSPFII